MAAGYNQSGQDGFSTISEDTAKPLQGNALSRSKFNPYTNPLSYSMRMGTFTRARSITHAGSGGLFLGKLMRPFAALAVGAATPMGAVGLGMLASASSDPDDIGSFAARSYVFGRLIGLRRPDVLTKSAGHLATTGGGASRALRWAGLGKQAAKLENFAVGGKSVLRGGLFGKLPQYGMYVPKSKALSRLYTGLGPGHALSGMAPESAASLIKGMSPYKKTIGYNTTKLADAKLATGPSSVFGYVPEQVKRTRITKLMKGSLGEVGLLPTFSGHADEIYNLAKKRKFKQLPKLIGRYNSAVAQDWGAIMSNFNAGGVSDFSTKTFYNNMFSAAGKSFPTQQKLVRRATGQYGTRAGANAVFGMESTLTPLGKAANYDQTVLRKFMTDPKYLAGRQALFANTQMGKIYATQFNKMTTPWLGGSLGAEVRLQFGAVRSNLFTRIQKQMGALGGEINAAKAGTKIRLAERLGSTESANAFVKGLPKAQRALYNKGVLTVGKNQAFKFGSVERLKSSVSMQNQLTSGIGNKAFSTFLWLTLGAHYGKKAIGGLLNATAKGIEAGSRLQMSMSHLEFGSGKSLNTQQASTERTRALQAIQSSGLNARSYLGKESQIYSQ